ncbi:MAG: KR domain-containing protein, partial [Paracoccaceae bacterium]|nr:KR domain-containing protein [Paracoccaceae bacterium]
LKEGRRAFEKRRVIVAESHEQAAGLLEGGDPRRIFSHDHLGEAPEVVFMFPGGGAQFSGMARDLYDTEPEFRDWMDKGLAILQPKLDYDIRALWLPEPGAEAAANARLKRPSVQLPLIMIVEYALARLYQSWGVQPAALVGHSMGENTAACLAGVIGFADCIGLVHLRGTLFDSIAPGGMLSVPLDEAELRPYLTGDLDLASVNAPGLCVVSGPDGALDALARRLSAAGTETNRIAIDIAAHSRMLEPILARFGDYLRAIPLHAPQIPIISNRTGKELTPAQAMDPDYWVAHLRNTVMFQPCMATLTAVPGRVYMEMGPGRALSSLAQANGVTVGQVVPALRHPEQKMPDDQWHIASIARLWACGVPVDWEPIWGGHRRNRVPLPGYAFQRKQYFIAPGKASALEAPALPMRNDDLTAWGWQPWWQPRAAECDVDTEADLQGSAAQIWLMFMDDAGLGDICAARLIAAGHRVIPVRAGDTYGPDGQGGFVLAPEHGRDGYDALIRDLVAQGTSPTRIAHFWLVTTGETFRPGSSFFHRNIEHGFYSLMFLAQAIAGENLAGPIHITALTTGAAQTRGEDLPYPEKATITGPQRVIPHELPGVTCATLDIVLPVKPKSRWAKADPAAMDRLVAQVLEDLLASPANVTAALRGERRYARGVKPLPLADTAEIALPQGAPVLITGGFGGIGLALAEDLIIRRGARIILIARTTLPDRNTWARHLATHDPADPISRRILALQRLEALGGEVLVAQADVCNVEDMRAALMAGEARFGPVRVVIHAAGVVDDAPLLAKSPASVEQIFAPKVLGTQVLGGLFPDGSLDLMVLFSSTSTVTGPAGQIDYVAANEYLNAYAQSRRGGKTRVVALNWGIWQDVGMAAEALAERAGTRPPAPRLPIRAPMLDEATFDLAGHRMFTARYDTERWVLDGHRTRAGQALIPGTGYLELAAEAMQAEGIAQFELRDLTFFRPLDVADDAPRDIRARLMRSEEGYGFDLRSGVDHKGRHGFQLNAQARLIPISATPGQIDVAAIAARCPQVTEDPKGLRSPQEDHLAFGPRWRVLTRAAIGQGEGIATLALADAFSADLAEGWLLHPALLDIATGWAMGLIAGYQPTHLWVPMSYARVRVIAPLPGQVTSWVRNAAPNRAADPVAVFDITLADAQGNICAEIEGFTIRKLEGALAMTAPEARDLEFEDAGAERSVSLAEERLLHNFTQGIRANEGPEAFHRALATGQSQVIVSSLDLPALIAQANTVEAAPAEGQSFARPDLDSAYVEPRNDVERRLVGFWQDLLGVGQVGVEDDFFALGGHSLIAVRLFAMVKKAYRVDFPISVLFEAPTIARCAQMITDQIGPVSDEGAAPLVVPVTRRFKYLVPMHDREGGPKTPFFVVAGMGGNVLNLRHMAQALGGDRRFYGLQARGLLGQDLPHATLTEAAADYLAELRQVQPHGPYLLGGYSGGGLTAWEMARQLEAAGETVALVVLLDTPMPVRPVVSGPDKALIKLIEIRRYGLGYLANWARKRHAWKSAERRARRAGPKVEALNQFHYAALETAFRAALPNLVLTRREAPALLFRPPLDLKWKVWGGRWVCDAKEYVYPDNDWAGFAPMLKVIEVPGDHDSMVLEPNVRVLIAHLRSALAQADAAVATAAQAADSEVQPYPFLEVAE